MSAVTVALNQNPLGTRREKSEDIKTFFHFLGTTKNPEHLLADLNKRSGQKRDEDDGGVEGQQRKQLVFGSPVSTGMSALT